MNRRSFAGRVVEIALGLIGIGHAKAEIGEHAPPQLKFKQVFKHDGYSWREIVWEDMRPGDRVVVVSIYEGKLSSLDAWIAGEFVPNEPNSGIHVQELHNLLPDKWGTGGEWPWSSYTVHKNPLLGNCDQV